MCLDMDKSLSIPHISSHMLQLSVLIESITLKYKMYTLAVLNYPCPVKEWASIFAKTA